ncbi:cell division protein FtsA [Brucella pituitosa]|uniref:Cell division protein FtsA n=1 Tax=Brucella pituitosa TaxID=571256 RepID=A0A643F195_9HYPH|nr:MULTISPECIES: cell division protein FtsA [Brucella]PQZ51533.1 cell division protein FtsA [Ochrobactrum sp. MYb19]PRA56198.1 cell division protein FtsA [Ochrobactrum sp. MYb68]PRA65434.1 cell division protein FtsA [Ochrobactrum sp. MYb18]PRA77124.1 cell division protein FtsA [Brucella thiophenivorans]PRA87998.1 cell division protein FtsA [Ochrobactrum sp. MYb29]PRA93242.1 cell division protein FtsA [Ochrobactrum sp. MYb14]PRA99133.1 cell division protein FtsA [Ochrobactrum sp. MYb15]
MSILGGKGSSQVGTSGRKVRLLTVLDVGSSKVSCVIARLRPHESGALLPGRTHRMEVLGIGHQRSRGVKSGVIIDLDAAEQSIRLAVDAAERMAGLTVDSLIVNISAGRLKSETFTASVNLGGHEVEQTDIRRVLAAGAKQALAAERHLVHSLPVGYTLDGERGIRDPLGMLGDSLGVDMHVLTADAAPLRNLELCVNRCHLSVEAIVATPYASGLAALVGDEAEMGAACIDMGGGTTTISVFSEGKFIHADAVAIGGNHVTMDVARGFSTRMEDAERLKVMYGSALPSAADDRDLISVPPIGDDERDVPNQYPRSVLTRIIRARVEETLELVRDRLNQSGLGHIVGKRVVLTGGASQLPGMPEAARRILARNVRIGRPLGIAGLPEAAKGAAFSATVGLLIYPQVAGIEERSVKAASSGLMTGTGGRIQRVSQWLRESF